MNDFSKYPENLKAKIIKVQKHLDPAAVFYGFKDFDDYMNTENDPYPEINPVLSLAELLHQTTLEAHVVFAERIREEIAFFHRTMKLLALLSVTFIGVAGILAGFIMLHDN